ncbi:MAG: protease pro-enzyme activation domain-containing protein, partial [Negativicutes bacterium]|nr:protease pro-enzyme activation domain-containing protein [Negativicutes bacterium]
MKNIRCLFMLAMLGLSSGASTAAEKQLLHNQIPKAVAQLRPIKRLPETNHLDLSIGLPLRNRGDLTNFLEQVSDPNSPNFRHYLTSSQFTEKFGPSAEDYAAVISFLNSQSLTVTGVHSGRTMVDFSGTVAKIERAFHVHLSVYNHPTEPRIFYAPDVEPSADTMAPILGISGLDNYELPHPLVKKHKVSPKVAVAPEVGSGPGGNLIGRDFRLAYVPNVALTGAGQTIGLMEFDGYYT